MLSIIMPNYNSGRFLHSAISSIINQTYNNIELIIIDDGSTDNSLDIINYFRNIDGRVILLKNKGTKGPSGARNTGLKAAKGNYVGFCDSDDLWKNIKAETQINFMNSNKDVISFSDSIIIDDSGKLKGEYFSDIYPPRFKHKKDYVFRSLIYGNFINTSSVILRNSYFSGALFDENFRYLEDWLFFIKIMKSIRISYLKKPLSYYRIHNESTNLDNRGYIAKRIKAYRHLYINYPNISPNRKSYLCRGIANNLFAINRYKLGRAYLYKAIRENPANLKSYYYLLKLHNNP